MRSRVCFVPLLLSLATPFAARADALVQVAPQRASGSQHPSHAPLLGFLARPYQAGRFPAVVLLHGCGGFSQHDVAVAAQLRAWGYVALALDSLGNQNWCDRIGGALAEAFDAYAALRFLAGTSYVQPDNIAVIGYSMGGIAALEAVQHDMPKLLSRGQPDRFRTAIAYYPPCQASTGNFDVPTLVLIGARDDWSSAGACRKMAEHRALPGNAHEAAGAPIRLVVYPNATHAFDYDEPPRHYLGHLEQYDASATADATTQLRRFLQAHFAASAPTGGTH